MPSIPSADGIVPVLLVTLASLAVAVPAAVPAGSVAGAAPAADAAVSAPAVVGTPGQSAGSSLAACPAGSGSPAPTAGDTSSASGPSSTGANETGNATVHLGDVAAVAPSVPPGENVTVEVGSSDGYDPNVRLVDDGDG